MSDLDALEQAARAEWVEIVRRVRAGYFDDTDHVAIHTPTLIAAVREADALREEPLDMERLAKALDNLWEQRWGPLPMPKGQTTINLENAAAIAAEYAALSPTEPAATILEGPQSDG